LQLKFGLLINWMVQIFVQNGIKKKRSFLKFSLKRRIFDEKDEVFGDAIRLIREKYEIPLTQIFLEQKYQVVYCFFEYFGQMSFAGNHEKDDKTKTVILIDVFPDSESNFLEPTIFIKLFSGVVEIPKLLYEGKANDDFVSSVQTAQLPNMTFEGVVCKGLEVTHKGKKLIFFKIKNQAWMDRLKNYCNDDQELYNRLL